MRYIFAILMNEKETIKISKFLSLVLRHKPQTIGLQLDDNGWAEVNEVIDKVNRNGFTITPDTLNHVVVTNNKKRFSFNEDRTKIRANQGHSIEINLYLKEVSPPQHLYHGTGERSVKSILATGLKKRNRQHVHLSSDIETAIVVGRRHGKPKVVIIEAAQMKDEGFPFYLSENGVWLTDYVPPEFLQVLEVPG